MLYSGTHQIYAENIKTKYMERCHLRQKLSRTGGKIIFVQVSPSKTKQISVHPKKSKTAKETTIS